MMIRDKVNERMVEDMNGHNQSIGPASEAESDSTPNATNKLDPLLMLGAFRAKLEKGADFTAATTETVVKVSDLPIGLYSLAGAMSSVWCRTIRTRSSCPGTG